MLVITIARKPLNGTVAANAMVWGCGGINIDASRIGYSADEPDSGANFYRNRDLAMPENRTNYFRGDDGVVKSIPSKVGRWPSNMLLSPEAAIALDEQSGLVPTGQWNRQTDTAHPFGDAKGTPYETWQEAPKESPAGASRYFKVVHL